jgi:hypothetical protein
MNYTNLTQDASLRTIEGEEFLSNRASGLCAPDDVFGPRTMNVVEIRNSFFTTPAVAGGSGKLASPKKPLQNIVKLVTAVLTLISAVGGGIHKLEVIVDAMQPSVSGRWELTYPTQIPGELSGRVKSPFLFKLNQKGHNLNGWAERIQDGNGKQSAQRERITLTGLVSGSEAMLCYTENSTPGQVAALSCFNLRITRSGVTHRASSMEGPFFVADGPTTERVVANTNWKRSAPKVE